MGLESQSTTLEVGRETPRRVMMTSCWIRTLLTQGVLLALALAPRSEAEISHSPSGFIREVDSAQMVRIPAAPETHHPAFLIDVHEITQRHYLIFVSETGTMPPSLPRFKQGAEHPVVGIPWDDAAAYCAWAEARLPTEGEWERAAGLQLDRRAYPWGHDWQEALANSAAASDGFACTATVGSFPDGASPYGVLDLAGNAEEWVDGSTQTGHRIARGGSWKNNQPEDFRIDRRRVLEAHEAGQWIGFRCAADLPSEPIP